MGFILLFIAAMFAGMFVYHLFTKHGVGQRLSGLSRFSSPYNALVTFALCVVLLLLAHNRLPAALGGSFVVVGIATVGGLVVRVLRPGLSFLGTRSTRQKRDPDDPWEMIDGEWVLKDPAPTPAAAARIRQ